MPPRSRATRSSTDAILKLKSRVGAYAYGEDDADLAAVVLDQCRELEAHACSSGELHGRDAGRASHDIPGSSDVFLGGVIAYHNDVKKDLLGVTADDLVKHGAVSEQVALQMAAGIRERTGADVGVSVTGIAGPGGGTPEKPVGLVWVAVHGSDAKARRFHVGGDRAEIRQRAAQAALEMVRRALSNG